MEGGPGARSRLRPVHLSVVIAMKGSIRIGSVRGVAVSAHWSVPLIMLLFAYGLASRTLPSYTPAWHPPRTRSPEWLALCCW